MALNILSLCSGGGGLELGIHLAHPNSRTVCYVEREAFAVECLASAMQAGFLDPAPVWSDVTTFDGVPWRGVVDILTAGYPCQPFSCIGSRHGENDPRHLWPHVRRIIEESQPQLVFLENVENHVRLGLDTVLTDLQRLGFRVTAGLYTAAELGANHRRRRVFILGMANPHPTRGRGSGPGLGSNPLPSGPSPSVADPHRNGSQGLSLAGPTSGPIGRGDGTTLFPPAPLSPNWPAAIAYDPQRAPALEPPLRGMADGMASWMDRLRLLGNGVVPLVSGYAFLSLLSCLSD